MLGTSSHSYSGAFVSRSPSFHALLERIHPICSISKQRADSPLVEAVGYVARAVSANQNPNYTRNPFFIELLLILLAPPLMAATIYMTLSRLILHLAGRDYAILSPRWLTAIFVFGDILSFLVQGGGGGMLVHAETQSTIDAANNIIVGGLVIQILSFGFFLLVAFVFHVRMARGPTPEAMSGGGKWRSVLATMYIGGALILLRSVYRLVEYKVGVDGALYRGEVFLYVLDALPMLLVVGVFCVLYPAKLLRRKVGMVQQAVCLDEVPSGDDERRRVYAGHKGGEWSGSNAAMV